MSQYPSVKAKEFIKVIEKIGVSIQVGGVDKEKRECRVRK
jgi:hypothetical protein